MTFISSIIQLIIIVIGVIFIIININKGGHEYSVNKDETLKINEYDESISIKVDSIDNAVYFSGYLY